MFHPQKVKEDVELEMIPMRVYSFEDNRTGFVYKSRRRYNLCCATVLLIKKLAYDPWESLYQRRKLSVLMRTFRGFWFWLPCVWLYLIKTQYPYLLYVSHINNKYPGGLLTWLNLYFSMQNGEVTLCSVKCGVKLSFTKLQRCNGYVISSHTIWYDGRNYISMFWSKSTHLSKRGPL